MDASGIAFDWIESTIPKGAVVLEFGSGEGSISLAQHYDLISVEHDEVGSAMQKIPRITLPPSLTTVFQSNTATLVGMNRHFLMPSLRLCPSFSSMGRRGELAEQECWHISNAFPSGGTCLLMTQIEKQANLKKTARLL